MKGEFDMGLTRRTWLGAAAASTLATSAAMAVGPMPSSLRIMQGSRVDYGAALNALKAYAQYELQTVGLPGMTLSVIDADGFAALMTFGWADLDRRIPVATNHIFEIGSISKAFAALTVFHLSEAGKIDLNAPLKNYLPDAPLPEEAITVAQVLSHTSGLPEDAPLFPRVPGGKFWTAFQSGSHFSYSNIGYQYLGELISAVTGRPHPEVIRDVVLKPLGMNGTLGVISNEDRAKYATGYVPFYYDRPALTGAPLVIAPWTDMDQASGSIASTAEEMTNYLRLLMHLGRGKGAPVLTDVGAQLFTTPVIDSPPFGPKSKYGNGLATVMLGGKPCLHHTGGMICFTSSFHVDPAAGVACFASVNCSLGDYRPRRTTGYAVELMRAARTHAKLPPPPDLLSHFTVQNPKNFAGRFVAPSGDALEIVASGGGLTLQSGGETGRLQPADKDTLVTDHARWAKYLLSARREHGKITALWWGNTLLGRDAPVAQPVVPPRLQALAGTYLNHDPWVGQANILAQGDKLVVEGNGTLVEAINPQWKLDEPNSPDRYLFDGMLNGRATRLNISGNDLYRVF
jgi:CubicO group peptidase (beta-lactamase class C family)